MSSLLSISLFCEASKEVEVFAHLLRDRMFPRSREINGFMYKGYSDPGRKTPISDINDLETRMPANSGNVSYHFRMMFSCKSGDIFPIEAILYGKGFDNGVSYRDCGPIRIIVTINDLTRPLWELLRVDDCMTPLSLSLELSDLALSYAEDLFFTTCGICDDCNYSESLINHGVMYLEYGCPSPVGASMLFHRHQEDFLVDYQRISANYQFGHVGSRIYPFEQHNSRLQFATNETIPHGKLHADFYKQFDPPDGANILRFLDNLTPERALKIQKALLITPSQWLSSHCGPEIGISYYQLKADSMALVSSNPLLSLWKCYNAFYDDMLLN